MYEKKCSSYYELHFFRINIVIGITTKIIKEFFSKDSREVIVNGELINLTAREYNILELLISNPKKVFTRANIFESVWNSSFLGDDNTVNVHVSNLRSKISAKDKTNEYIQTVWGIGFKMKDD